jgi:hypothetical protein
MTGFFNRLRSVLSGAPSNQPDQSIHSYGQEESGMAEQDIQPIVEWLFLSLLNAGYNGKSHLFWLHEEAEPGLNRHLQQLDRKGEPIFAYRCGNRLPMPPDGYYWRMIPEHPSMRVYQLEVRDDD